MGSFDVTDSFVNYSHLKEGASSFNEATYIKINLNVEVSSPEALISVVPTVSISIFPKTL